MSESSCKIVAIKTSTFKKSYWKTGIMKADTEERVYNVLSGTSIFLPITACTALDSLICAGDA
ncbi:hypothetical protein Mapa_013660 [Marchantia paleacea]|nr:hypothetical protein Mapa_013660 [Marchantia paleacea]